MHSCQIQHSPSTEAAVTAEAAVLTAEAEAALMEAVAVFTAVAEAPTLAADLMAAIAGFVAAASMPAGGPLAEEVTTQAADWEPAAVQARREIGGREVGRRMFLPPSTMASGIRSATRLAPRVPVRDTIPEAWPTQVSRLATPELPMAIGIPLARQEALRNQEEEARPISADASARRPPSVGAAMVGEAVGGVTIGTAGGVGEVGASASAGRTGVFIGDRLGRLVGILGGMALLGMARGPPTLTIRTTATIGPAIRRHTDRIHPRIRPMTATRRQATCRQTRTTAPTITMMRTISVSTLDQAQATPAHSRTARHRSRKLRRTVQLQWLSRRVPQD